MALRLAARQARLVAFGYNAVTSRIEWLRSPGSPQYTGASLSLNGARVMAYYKDGTTSDVTASCDYDPAEGARLENAGELNITASYKDHAGNEFTADTQIKVADMLRTLDASAVVFSPAAGEIIGHMDTLSIRATWKNPATSLEYTAEYPVTIDMVDGIYFAHAPNKTRYTEGELLDLTGATVALKYMSGDIMMVTQDCTFSPKSGDTMGSGVTSIHAAYQTAAGNQYEAETFVNGQTMTVPINVIGQLIGEDLGLEFTEELPSDFWNDFIPQDVPYIPADGGSYYLSEDTYSSIVDYLAEKDAFASYHLSEGIPYMIIPAGRYPSADGTNAIEATADIYIIAAMFKVDGKPETLPGPSIVDYPYTNLFAYNQIHVLTFTLNASDYVRCKPGLRGGYNSATSGICRKMAGLGLPDVDDDTRYTNYVTFPDDAIVNIPGILALPWCWYDDLPKDLDVLKSIVQLGSETSGCKGITHIGKVPYLTYSKGSLFEEVKEQFPELFDKYITYGDKTYVHVAK